MLEKQPQHKALDQPLDEEEGIGGLGTDDVSCGGRETRPESLGERGISFPLAGKPEKAYPYEQKEGRRLNDFT